MFLRPKIYEKSVERFSFTKNTVICVNSEFEDYIRSTLEKRLCADGSGTPVEKISFQRGFPKRIRERIADTESSDEAYAIMIGKHTRVYAACERGYIYAVSMLLSLFESQELFGGFLYDFPRSSVRGYRAFLPGRKSFDAFYKTVDLLAYYKFNSIILEIGGAMEYERHPEINDRWAEFCREVHAYPGRAHEIQHRTYPWQKCAIHCDNGEGDVLTKDECRALAAYCRSRGLEVIPECPSYSHADYLVMAHPEIREIEGDEYPDTYCPFHPNTYPLLFDVLDEVIEVFEPKMINIGHDEAYTLGRCKKCRQVPAYVLYADDIKKIHAYLKERGIKTMMWGEKLLNSFTDKGLRVGGSGRGVGHRHVPALYPCRDLLPKDITFLHWYWVFNPDYDNVFHERGYKVVFGNLAPLGVKHWDLRTKRGIDGGFVSNWGSFHEEYMQRNKQYFDLISAAYAFWCEDFGSLSEDEKLMLTMREANRLKLSRTKNPLIITHRTDCKMKYTWFYDGIFIDYEKDNLGRYEICYEDGQVCCLPITYGMHIAASHFDDYLHESGFQEISYTTMPQKLPGGFAYSAVYEDPNPEGKITSIAFVPNENKPDAKVELIGFSRSYTPEEAKVTKTVRVNAEFAIDGKAM